MGASDLEQKKIVETGRMQGPEVLRCIAMMMVIILHFLDKGKYLEPLEGSGMTNTGMFAWLLEAFAISAVNLYMLISGYFLCETSFKLSRIITLLIQVWTYSVLVGAGGILLGFYPIESVTLHDILVILFPISQEHYWFLTAYFYLYLLLPIIGGTIRKMEQRTFRIVLALFLGTFCVMKSILPVRLETDGLGMDCLWYLCMFLTAAYFRRFGTDFLKKSWKGFLLYGTASLAVFGLTFLIREIYLRKDVLKTILCVAYEYNHLFTFAASLGLFTVFIRQKECAGIVGRWACRIGKYTLGVYLLHENTTIRTKWPEWFGNGQAGTDIGNMGTAAFSNGNATLMMLFRLMMAVCVVFIVGILVECLRSRLMSILHVGLQHLIPYQRLTQMITKADSYFSEKRVEKG